MKLTNLINKLGSFEPDGHPFISLYLNAEANDIGRDGFAVWLKKEFSDARQNCKDDASAEERFDIAVERINKFIEEESDSAANGIAVFTSLGDSEVFEAVQLDLAFHENKLIVYDRPHVYPLARTVFQNPRYAVLWADTNKADIYIFGGENRIRTDSKVDEIQNTVTNRSQVGGWSQSRYQRHVDNFHLQHAKEVVAELEDVMKKSDVEYLVLCGDETAIMPILRPQLSKALEEKVIAVLSMSQYESADEIHEKTLEAVGIENATRDSKAVERVHDAAKAAAGMGTLGLEETLRALANGQVEELVISSNLDSIEYSNSEVKKILKEYRPGDDNAPTDKPPAVESAEQIADELILRAVNTDARIIFVEDESLLKDSGGVGSILRYNINTSASA